MLRLAVACVLGLASADVYWHNPKGANNRLDDQNRDRNNANRMCDTQNNNRGGSNVGSLYYYAGSVVPLEWTQQHSCGNPNNNCEIIIQAMCSDRLRDGTTTRTIPITPNECYDYDCDTDVRFGRHESVEYYLNCQHRERNMGLFTASQNVRGRSAVHTRQNRNGARRGLECPEERDYYPYWGPTPWRDIAILTNHAGRCAAYQAESQNVKERWYCYVPINGYMRESRLGNEGTINGKLIPINATACQELSFQDPETNRTVFGNWTMVPPFGLEPPTCSGNVWSRDNHLGNVFRTGQTSTATWTVPRWMIDQQCVLRIRYNISTGDLAHFDEDVLTTTGLNASQNRIRGRGPNAGIANVTSISEDYGLANYTYRFENNPEVSMGLANNSGNLDVQLAINTAQFGRTFQDRTHSLTVKEPILPENTRLTNINVRGKRGNIVQTFPGTEYDFVPNKFHCQLGDYVHLQWTGSNTNPNNNAGQGRQGSDRNNMVMLKSFNYAEPGQQAMMEEVPVHSAFGNSMFNPVTGEDSQEFIGINDENRVHLANLDSSQLGGEMSELDDAGTYFDGGVHQCTENGYYHYMCTRNNNFSNRSQKGQISVTAEAKETFTVGGRVDHIQSGAVSLDITPEALPTTLDIDLRAGPSRLSDVQPASHVATVYPEDIPIASGETVTLNLAFNQQTLQSPRFYWSLQREGPFEELDGDVTWSDGIASVEVTQGGTFFVKNGLQGGYVALIVILSVLFVVAVGAGIFLYKKRQEKGSPL